MVFFFHLKKEISPTAKYFNVHTKFCCQIFVLFEGNSFVQYIIKMSRFSPKSPYDKMYYLLHSIN